MTTSTRLWGIEVHYVQWIVRLFNNIMIVQLMGEEKNIQKTKKLHKTGLKVGENNMILELYSVCVLCFPCIDS